MSVIDPPEEVVEARRIKPPKQSTMAIFLAWVLVIIVFTVVQVQQVDFTNRLHDQSTATIVANRALLQRICTYEKYSYERRVLVDKTLLGQVVLTPALIRKLNLDAEGVQDVRNVYTVINDVNRDRLQHLLDTLRPPESC